MKPIEKEQPVLRYGYDSALAVNKDGSLVLGAPPFLGIAKTNPNVFVSYSVFYERSLEELAEMFNVSFPIVLEENNYIDPALKMHSYVPFLPGLEVKLGTVDEYMEQENKFVYPIPIFSMSFFESEPLRLPNNVLHAINKGLCKVAIMLTTEGTEIRYSDFEWMKTFSRLNSLDSSNFIFTTNNQLVEQQYNAFRAFTLSNNFVTVFKDMHFEDHLWFIQGHTRAAHTRRNMWAHLENQIQRLNKAKYDKHFLCFNRRSRIHRTLIYSAIMSNDKVSAKGILTLGREDPEVCLNIKRHITHVLENEARVKNKDVILEYLDTLDLSEDKHFDIDSQYNAAGNLNRTAHESTFLNLVNETLVNSGTVFFSEKIFKPIYMCQPFILYSSRGSLRTLRELGYKTFDKWWDESYDDIEHWAERASKIVEVLEEISTWSQEKLVKIRKEMRLVVEHNFYTMMDNTRALKKIELFKVD